MRTKIRKPWLAGLLSLLFPGLGHIYCGKAKHGIILYFCLEIITLFAFAIILLPIPILNVAITVLIILSAYICVIIDSVKTAKVAAEDYELKKYNRWYVYIGVILITGLLIDDSISWATKRYYIQSFKIPSGAMMPTVEIGDHIITNKFIYELKKPEHNDVIVFIPPHDPDKKYIKRVVGVEGDVVEIRDKQLYINNKKITGGYEIFSDPSIIPKSSTRGIRDNFSPVIVPDDSYFVLGDNRDQSYDSRFWGFVNREAVKGKVQTTYWSWDKENTLVRWSRIGQIIK
ncbi:MAG: signal peptidase I [Desulfobacterales bacterium]|jgi:signal peptidase I|nr:signal peptidase I [Desulfobacterales bacterium]MBT7696213.1 signal peptidase I [Desulfobacterales bacterium]